MQWWIFAVVGYVCGSIPFGLLLTRAAGLGDVRNIGSGSIGATNVMRTGSKKLAALTLFFDMAKGLLPVVVAIYSGIPFAELAAGFGAMAGHVFPVWLRFKGGKGVATGLGVMLGWSWIIAFLALGAWIAVFIVTRISSLSALVASVAAVLLSYLFEQPIWPMLIMAAAVFFTHRTNIGRLLRGEEPKTTFSKKA